MSNHVFRPRAHLMATLGEELISSDMVALTELVKNSYDADANNVLIRFTPPVDAGHGSVEVLDDGHGMSIDVVRGAWLEPATNYKRNRDRTESTNRRLLGEKGVGRFAAARLGQRMQLVSRRQGDDSEAVLDVDWEAFRNEDKYLDEIPVKLVEREATYFTSDGDGHTQLARGLGGDRPPESGTLLRIAPLRSTWTDGHFKKLTRSLARLVSPRFEHEGFRIQLEVPKPHEDFSQTISQPELLERPRYQVFAEIDAYGRIEATMSDRENPQAKPSCTPNDSLQHDDPDATPSACGPLLIELRIWDRERDDLKTLASQLDMKISDLRKDLDDAAGISIYRDDFRIMPYGEQGNDWLNLDARRVQNPTLRLSNNQVVGFAFIDSDNNPDLRDKTNREGMIDNDAYADLRSVVLKLMAWVEEQRFGLRAPEREKRKRRPGLFAHPKLDAVGEYIDEKYHADKRLGTLVDRAKEEAKQVDESAQETISRYRRLANLGGLVDKILHDAGTPLGSIRSQAQLGIQDAKPSIHESEMIFGLHGRLVKIDASGRQLDHVLRGLRAFGGRKRGRPTETAIESIIAEAFDMFSGDMAALYVEVSLPETQTVVRVEPGEMKQVLMNLIINSLHWLKHVPRERRRIRVTVTRPAEESVQIVFADSGPGVSPAAQDHIFEPYFSTKPAGVGLGLAIAGEIVADYYNGSLELLREGGLDGATFRITLNRRV